MKEPGFFTIIKIQYYFVHYLKRPHFKTNKFPQHLIVVAGYVIYLNSFAHPVHKVLYNLHVAFGPVPFAELPNINDIAIQYHRLWFYGF